MHAESRKRLDVGVPVVERMHKLVEAASGANEHSRRERDGNANQEAARQRRAVVCTDSPANVDEPVREVEVDGAVKRDGKSPPDSSGDVGRRGEEL
eukprot:SAG31_NODE_30520_length_380_cov_0.601423_1_plen_95_part_10